MWLCINLAQFLRYCSIVQLIFKKADKKYTYPSFSPYGSFFWNKTQFSVAFQSAGKKPEVKKWELWKFEKISFET